VGIFWNLWPEINYRVALTKVFLEPVSFISTADKFVTSGWQTGQPSLTTLTMNGSTSNAKHGLTLGNGQIWLGAPPVVLQLIFVFFHCVVLQFPLRENIRSHSDIGKMTECF